MDTQILQSQIDYYRARAQEYDQWFFREGRYDRGEELNARWFAEVAEVRKRLVQFDAHGDVLELAGGTGLWTELLARTANSLTVVDASPEVIEINRARVDRTDTQYIVADLFEWQPESTYDAIFFSFWLSHVPYDRFVQFWRMLMVALRPGGSVFLIDSLFEHSSTAKDHLLLDSGDSSLTRKLNDGREFQIIKVFYSATELSRHLEELGWSTDLQETEKYFVYGQCRPTEMYS
jgi:2-polyprenyl-3-methyl-5-hydroxy-6-metoxy-1,4-benzoquinol methylase